MGRDLGLDRVIGGYREYWMGYADTGGCQRD